MVLFFIEEFFVEPKNGTLPAKPVVLIAQKIFGVSSIPFLRRGEQIILLFFILKI